MSEISATVKVEDISAVKKKIHFHIPWADVKQELDEAYRKIGKKAKIKGFRPGKTPRQILERFYREQAEEDTLTNLVNRFYWETLQKESIQAVAHPEIEQKGIELEKDFQFSATVEVEPVIEPRDYLGLELQKGKAEVTDQDLEKRLEEISQMFATMEDLAEDRGALTSDFVTIDFAGSVGGESLPELKADNHLLELGSKSFIPGFEEQLIGMKKGEQRTISVRFPDDYGAAHLAGKEAAFMVSLKGIRIKKVPAIDQEFVKNFDRYESIEALRADVRKGLVEEAERKVATAFDRHIDDKLLAANDFEVPPSFVERQIYYMMSDAQRRLVANGMEAKKAAEFSMKLHDQLKEEATRTVKTVLLIKNIAHKEAISVNDEELEKRVREMAAQRSQGYETMRANLEKEDLLDHVRSELLSRKTYDYLVSKANVTVVAAGQDSPVEA